MNCTNCQKAIPDGADFCKYCGAPAPFQSGINYHPETLFSNETVGGSAYSFASVEKSMTEMEARLNEKLYKIIPNQSPNKNLWSQIQTFAVLVLVVFMIAGTFLFSRLITKLNQVNVTLETVLTASSETRTSIDNSPRSPAVQVILHLNYEEAGAAKNLDSVTMLPGDILSLATLTVPKQEGYELIGWNTKKDGNGDQYAQDAEIGYFGYDVELFAQWESVDPAPETTIVPVG